MNILLLVFLGFIGMLVMRTCRTLYTMKNHRNRCYGLNIQNDCNNKNSHCLNKQTFTKCYISNDDHVNDNVDGTLNGVSNSVHDNNILHGNTISDIDNGNTIDDIVQENTEENCDKYKYEDGECSNNECSDDECSNDEYDENDYSIDNSDDNILP